MKRALLICLLLLPALCFAQIAEDFESGNISAWQQTPDSCWAASPTQTLSGNFSLKHIYDNTASGKDRISVRVENINVSAGDVTWRFLLRHGYKPSANNYWAAFLLSDVDAKNMVKDSSVNAYAVGVNLIGSDDLLKLFKITNGTATEILNTNLNWETNIKTSAAAGIEIVRKQSGEWSVRVDTIGDFLHFENYGTPTIDTEHTVFNYFGILYAYTSSADQKLWIDNLSITSTALPAEILSVTKQTKKQLMIKFSKPIKSLSNIGLKASDSSSVTIFSHEFGIADSSKIILNVESLYGRKFVLNIGNFVDVDNNSASTSKIFFIDNFDYGDVVFNEIMFRPQPEVGLPNRKYIEVYNRTPYTINFNNWKILYDDSGVGRIAADSIQSGQYAILCVSTAVADLSQFGKTISVVSFPSLSYSGQSLQLVDFEGTLVSRVDYLPDWHSDTAKTNGGWSLEKLDVNNLAELSNNWKSSNDALGGTPGRENSVACANADTATPQLQSWTIVGNNVLQLVFNKPLNGKIDIRQNIYNADNGLNNPIKVDVDYNLVQLEFGDTITIGVIYTLYISDDFEDVSGNKLQNFALQFGTMKKAEFRDIIINEVLFNPYSGGADFVELYNRSHKNIDVSNLYLATRNDSDGTLKTICKIADKNKFFEPSQFVVATTNSKIIAQQYFVPDTNAIIQIQQMPAYSNSRGYVVLLDDFNNVVDEFDYDEKMHSKFLSDVKGVSLERADYDAETNSAANWHSASADVGYATPTYKNSQAATINENYGFTLSPKTISPDGDGFDDVLTIAYAMPDAGYVANIKIYDARGRWICDVCNNALLGREGTIVWNGMNEKNTKVGVGVYVVFIEYFNLEGKVVRDKKVCVVAAKK